MTEAQTHSRRRRPRLDWWEEGDLARKAIPEHLAGVLELLKKVSPTIEEFDVIWPSPYIRYADLWRDQHFSIYRGHFFALLDTGDGSHRLKWAPGSDEVEFMPFCSRRDDQPDEAAYEAVLLKVEDRLKSIVQDFPAYNHWLEKRLSKSYRTGRIQRGLTWPENVKLPISQREIAKFEKIMRNKSDPPHYKTMTLEKYLKAVAIAYEPVYEHFRDLSLRKKYKVGADGRHGGLHDLPLRDADAFKKWFDGREYSGAHPWEIKFGEHGGIILRPCQDDETGLWHFDFGTGNEGYYVEAARMAMALVEHGIPIDYGWRSTLAAFRGLDEVEVGSGIRRVHYEQIKMDRADSLRRIRWEPLELWRPSTPEQVEVIDRRLRPELAH